MAASPPGGLDDVSKRIVELLQEDGRRAYADIAREIGLSETAVRQRTQKLIDSGTLQIVGVTNPLQLGFPRQAMVGIRVNGDTRAVAAELEKIRSVDYVVLTAGSFDILIEIVCASDSDLIDLLNSSVRTLPGVDSTETFVYLEQRKQSYNWGTR